jgi:hypothetical protein
MIRLNRQFINLPFVFVSDAPDYCFDEFRYIAFQYRLTILGRPDKMVFQIIDRMAGSFDGTQRLSFSSSPRPTNFTAFIPAASCEAFCGG